MKEGLRRTRNLNLTSLLGGITDFDSYSRDIGKVEMFAKLFKLDFDACDPQLQKYIEDLLGSCNSSENCPAPSPEFLKDELACSVVRSLPKSSGFASLKVGSISGFTVSSKDDEGSGQLDEHVDYCRCL